MIVVDASAVGTFLIPDEAGPFADFARSHCREASVYVPGHWHAELASLIRNSERRGRLTEAQRIDACGIAQALAGSVTVAPMPPLVDVVAAGATLSLSTYDAIYFMLARELGAPLLTEDAALVRVARSNGVTVLAP